MPLTVDIFGMVTDLSTPLWIRTNPYYDTDPNEGLTQVFLHMFGLDGAGPEDPFHFVVAFSWLAAAPKHGNARGRKGIARAVDDSGSIIDEHP